MGGRGMIDFKGRFAEFSNSNYYSRIDETHILELHLGLDDKGRKSFEFRYPFKPVRVKSTSAIEVNQYKKDDYNTLRFSLTDDKMSLIFYSFCEDIAEHTRNLREAAEGYQVILNRFYMWKKMFVPPKDGYLTEEGIKGLIGEITFLRTDLKARLGLSEALLSWSGQELTHKDFSYNDTWTEVKSISSNKETVHISSIEQLTSDCIGELVIFKLEKMSPQFNGIKLNALVKDTLKLFDKDKDMEIFLEKVYSQGYTIDEYYDEFVYVIKSKTNYIVDETFPKLTRDHLPEAIVKASYEISLTELSAFVKK